MYQKQISSSIDLKVQLLLIFQMGLILTLKIEKIIEMEEWKRWDVAKWLILTIKRKITTPHRMDYYLKTNGQPSLLVVSLRGWMNHPFSLVVLETTDRSLSLKEMIPSLTMVADVCLAICCKTHGGAFSSLALSREEG
jgi:hypothetical protein